MGNLLFWLGLGGAQKGAGSKEIKPSRHWVISFVVGILLALLIVAGLFILLCRQPWPSLGPQQRRGAAHSFVLGTSQEDPAMASTNKSLAQINKSADGGSNESVRHYNRAHTIRQSGED